MRWSLVLFVTVLPLLAQAKDPLASAEAYLEEMEYVKALRLVDRVLASSGRGPGELVKAYRIQGLCQAAAGKTEASMQAFRRLLSIDPEFRLSTEISPRLAGGFYQAVAYSKNNKPITLVHRPSEPPRKLAGLELAVELQADSLGMVKAVRLVFSSEGGADQIIEVPVGGLGKINLTLPDEAATKLDYYFEALNERGSVLARVGSVDDRLGLAVASASVVVKKPLTPPHKPEGVRSEPAGQDWKDEAEVSAESRWYASWWFWTTVGVVVAGATVGATLAVTSNGSSSGPVNYGIELE